MNLFDLLKNAEESNEQGLQEIALLGNPGATQEDVDRLRYAMEMGVTMGSIKPKGVGVSRTAMPIDEAALNFNKTQVLRNMRPKNAPVEMGPVDLSFLKDQQAKGIYQSIKAIPKK